MSASYTAMRLYDFDGMKVVANNGAAGMPNARGSCLGILTRIGTNPSPYASLYGHSLQDVHVNALAINYDDLAWQQCFLENWPEGSSAWLSYFDRISNGPKYCLECSTGLAMA